MTTAQGATPVKHESPTLIDYRAQNGRVLLTLDTHTMQATHLQFQDTAHEPAHYVLELSGTTAGAMLGTSPWLVHVLGADDVQMLINIAAAGSTEGVLGYLTAVLENQSRHQNQRWHMLRALRAGLSAEIEHRAIEEPQTPLYVAHPESGIGAGNYRLYLTAPENPYGSADVDQHTSRRAPARAHLLICESVADDHELVLVEELDWPLVSTAMPANQRMLDALAESPVLIEQLILASLSAEADDAQRMVAHVQSRLNVGINYALSSLAVIGYPERTTEAAPAPITITASQVVTGQPVWECDILTCYPDAARYQVSLKRLRRHDAALARAIDKDALAEAVTQTQWLRLKPQNMSESRLRAALSDICADLIQEAAETLEA